MRAVHISKFIQNTFNWRRGIQINPLSQSQPQITLLFIICHYKSHVSKSPHITSVKQCSLLFFAIQHWQFKKILLVARQFKMADWRTPLTLNTLLFSLSPFAYITNVSRKRKKSNVIKETEENGRKSSEHLWNLFCPNYLSVGAPAAGEVCLKKL